MGGTQIEVMNSIVRTSRLAPLLSKRFLTTGRVLQEDTPYILKKADKIHAEKVRLQVDNGRLVYQQGGKFVTGLRMFCYALSAYLTFECFRGTYIVWMKGRKDA